MSGFQQFVQQQPAPAVEGDFASSNPRSSVPPVVGGAFKVAAGQSVRVGYFAWAAVTGLVYSSAAGAGAGATLAFVARTPNEPSVVITAFLGESRMTLEAGMPCTLMNTGDYWVNAAGVVPGGIIYADPATGQPLLVDGGGANPDTGYRAASVSKVNGVTAAAGASIAANTGILTLGAPASGVYEVGQRVTGVGVAPNTYITAQLTGAAGLAGTYATNSTNRAAVAAFLATMVQGTLVKISKPR